MFKGKRHRRNKSQPYRFCQKLEAMPVPNEKKQPTMVRKSKEFKPIFNSTMTYSSNREGKHSTRYGVKNIIIDDLEGAGNEQNQDDMFSLLSSNMGRDSNIECRARFEPNYFTHKTDLKKPFAVKPSDSKAVGPLR